MMNPLQDILYFAAAFNAGELYGWQQHFCEDALSGQVVALRAANGSGKTRTLALLILALMSKYPGIKVCLTNGSWRQIETQLYPILRRLLAGMSDWTITSEKITAPVISLHDSDFQSIFIPFSTNDPGKAEGYHGEDVTCRDGFEYYTPLAMIFDEAKSIDQKIFDAKDRCRPDFEIIASSPGEDFGPYYDCFERNASLYKPHVVNWTQCPHLYDDPVERKKIEKKIRVMGENDPLIQSMFFANWMRAGGYYLFPDAGRIKVAMAGTNAKFGNERRAALDTSDGGDEQVLGLREGNTEMEMVVYNERDAVKLARLVQAQCKRWGITGPDLVVDNGGAGKTLTDFLRTYGLEGVRRYRNDEAARDKTLYGNRYSEDAFEKLAYRLDTLNLLPDETLERQMRQRKYIMPNDDSNRRRLEPKETLKARGQASPDRLDMLIMLFSDMPHPDQYVENRKEKTAFDRYRRLCAETGTGWEPYAGMRCDSGET